MKHRREARAVAFRRAATVAGILVVVLSACTAGGDAQSTSPSHGSLSTNKGDVNDGADSPIPAAAFMDLCAARGDQGGESDCANQTDVLLDLAARPLRDPSPQDCPVSRGRSFDNGDFRGIALGRPALPVFPVVVAEDPNPALRGTLRLRRRGHWWSIKTAWFARPAFEGPFLVRAARADGKGVVRFGESPTARMLAVRGGTLNESNGFRSVPGATFLGDPGCYFWQVDGVEFSYRIVFEARTRPHPPG